MRVRSTFKVKPLRSLLLPHLFILFSVGVSAAQEVITTDNKHIIVGAQLSGLFHLGKGTEDRGIYFDIIHRALKESGLSNEFEINVMPMSRAKKDFVEKKYACYAPGITSFDLVDEAKDLGHSLISTPLNRASVRVITKFEENMVIQASDIPNHSVLSIVRGTPMSKEMRSIAERATQMFYVNSETENLQMLLSGKVDYIFAFYPDILFAYDQLGIEPLPYSKSYTPLALDDTVLCHPEFEQAFTRLDEKLMEYKRDGTLKEMLGPLYMLTDESEH